MASRFQSPTVLIGLLAVVLVVLVTTMAVLGPSEHGNAPISNHSVYSLGDSGGRAWYLALKKSGFPVKVWQKSFLDLDSLPMTATMVIVEPYTVAKTSIIFGQQEVDSLLGWVKRGNTLVLLDGYSRYGSSYLLTRLMRQEGDPMMGSYSVAMSGKSGEPLQLAETLKGPTGLLKSFVQAPLITRMSQRFRLFSPLLPTRGQVLLEDSRHRPVLVRLRYGQGHLLLGTPVDLLENRYLQPQPANDNFQFLTNLLTMEQKPVYINEFVHGYSEITDLLSYFQQNTPLGKIFAQLGLAFLFVLWLSVIRWKPKPSDVVGADEAMMQDGLNAYVQSVAGIYYRTRSTPLVLGPQLREIEALLRKRYRMALSEEARLRPLLVSLADGYSDKGASPDGWLETIRKARDVVRRQERLSHRETLQLCRQLMLIQETLQHGQRIAAK